MRAVETKTIGGTSAALTIVLPLVLIVIVASLLRGYQIGRASAWTDELSSLQFSCGRGAGSFGGQFDAINSPGVSVTSISEARGWSDTWSASASDTHPPLHAILLRMWRTIFGDSDVAARSLSAVCSVLATVALFDAVRSLHSARAGLFAAAIMAVASPQIVNAQEARGYAMVVLLTLTMTAILLRIETRGRTRAKCIALFIATIAALLTHYAAMPFTLASIAYAIVRMRASARRDALIAFISAAIVFALVWGSIFVHQQPAMRANLAWLADDGPGFYVRWLQRLATLPLRLFITPKKSDAESLSGMVAAICYLAPLLLIRDRKFLVWILIAGATIGAVAMSDAMQQRRALDWERYTLVASPALYAIIASLPMLKRKEEAFDREEEVEPAPTTTLDYASIGRPRRAFNLLWLVPVVFVLGCVLSLEEAYSRYWKADFRGFARELDSFAGPDELLITHAATRDDWKNAILLAAISHDSQHPKRPTLILTKPFNGDVHDAVFISTQSDFAFDDWLKNVRVLDRRTIPFVGSMMRIRVGDELKVESRTK